MEIETVIQNLLRGLNSRKDLLVLFRETLGFEAPAISVVPFDIDRENIKEAETIAEFGPVKVFYINFLFPIDETFTGEKKIRKIERQTISKLQRSLRRQNLFIFSDSGGKYWDFIYPSEYGPRLVLKRFSIRSDNRHKLRTPATQLANLAIKADEKEQIYKKLEKTFSVEEVSEKFFKDYDEVFNAVRNAILKQSKDRERVHRFVHQLLNRLMFLYFVQRRGVFNGDKNFLATFWNAYRNNFEGGDEFYNKWLKILFFEAMNGKFYPRDYLKISETINFNAVLQVAPHLNGGLFREDSEIDFLDIKLADNLFVKIFDFLESYNFTVRESTPLDEDLEIDPEMLGNIYEAMVNVTEISSEDERHKAGIFYTPRTEIEFMLRRSLVEYLFNKTKISKLKFYQFIFPEFGKEKIPKFTPAEARQLFDILSSITVVDPACGSGHYLVVAVQIIFDLKKELWRQLGNSEESFNTFEEKLKIIENSIFGVDIKKWAAEIAKLRLWLDLMVEAKDEQFGPFGEALLPNLAFKIRVGDSLVQEIGGIVFRAREIRGIPRSLVALKNQLIDAKKAYFYGEKGITEPMVKSREIEFFQALLDEKINELKGEIQKLEAPLYESFRKQLQLLTHGEKDANQLKLELSKKEQEKVNLLKEQITHLQEEKQKISMKSEFAFWPIEFAEVLAGRNSKGGFDIVIANPPYVRQELISDPQKPNNKKVSRQYKESLLRQIRLDWDDERGSLIRISQRADLYVYFYLKGLQLLNPDGVMCYISSNSWIDVDFGAGLQEVLLRRVPIFAIYDNQAKRSFKHADINTVIVVLGAPRSRDWNPELKNNEAKFVMFKKPFEEVSFSEILWQIDNAKKERISNGNFRLVQKNQWDLYLEGIEEKEDKKRLVKEMGSYTGNKWGGKYLRAPDIYWIILKKGGLIKEVKYEPTTPIKRESKVDAARRARGDSSGLHNRSERILLRGGHNGQPKLVRLGDIAEIRFGIKTGANEFFYLEDITDKNMTFEEIKPKIQNLGNFKSLTEIKKAGLRICRNTKTGDYWLIEEEFLKPVIKSPKECESIIVDPKRLQFKVFICIKSKSELKKTFALKYMEWGENKKLQKAPTIANRTKWWELPKLPEADILFNQFFNERFLFPWNKEHYLVDHAYYYVIYPKNTENLVLILNSIINFLMVEIYGRTGLGQGALQTYAPEMKPLIILNPTSLNVSSLKIKKTIENYSKHKPKSIFDELNMDSHKPIREQEPKPLPDRKALDDIVFDALGLTEEERKEVYWAVAELVKNRLEKAKSI